MKYIYVLLFVLIGSPVLASVYATQEAADEGIRRGASEPFTGGVGYLQVVRAKDGVIYFGNATLISDDRILTNAHLLFPGEELTRASAIFYPDTDEFNKHINACEKDGKNWRTEPFLGAYLSGKQKTVMDIVGFIDLDSIDCAPFGTDLAIARLKNKLPHVPKMPLLLGESVELPSGYLISHAPTAVLEKEIAPGGKRHISIVKMDKMEKMEGAAEMVLVPELRERAGVGKDDKILPVWARRWELPKEVACEDLLGNLAFVPKEGDHRLLAYTRHTDSGAPFVFKGKTDHFMSGVYCMRIIKPKSTTSAEGGDTLNVAHSVVLPLWPLAGWIDAHR